MWAVFCFVRSCFGFNGVIKGIRHALVDGSLSVELLFRTVEAGSRLRGTFCSFMNLRSAWAVYFSFVANDTHGGCLIQLSLARSLYTSLL